MDIKEKLQAMITAARMRGATEIADVINEAYREIVKLERKIERLESDKGSSA
jgi:hypothetical protein